MKVVTIDCQYLFPRYAASYLVTDGERALVVDNNTTHSVPLILKALKEEGLTPEKVDYLIVTHVHLDHAGGSSALLRECPNAKLLAHPRAVPHLVDPSKLISSARKVYGDEKFEKLYGWIDPIAAERVRAMEDGEVLSWQWMALQFLHTRGHANHHFCISFSEGGRPRYVFTGDAFGLAYPDLQKAGLFVFPSTSPTDFDAGQARLSIDRIQGIGAPVAYPTHFGPVREIAEAARQLKEGIDFSEALLQEAVQSEEADDKLDKFCETRVRAHFLELFKRRGMSWDKKAQELLDLDMELNGAGIAHVARKIRRKKAE